MGFNSAFKGLNAELNPICHLLALLGAHHILHFSRVRVKLLVLKVTATGYALVLLPIFQTVRCQILQVYNINNIAE